MIFTFTVRATDPQGWYRDQKFTLEVIDNPFVHGQMAFLPVGTSGQTFTVPPGVPSSNHPLIVTAWGAGGGKAQLLAGLLLGLVC